MWVPRDWSDIKALLGVSGESEQLDLKRELPKQGHHFPKDIAAMSKAGGVIVYGVDEDKPRRVAGQITAVPIDGTEERIRSATQGIEPHIEFEVRVLRAAPADATGVIAVIVPASPDWPHMVDGRYPIRHGTTTRYLSHEETRSALGGTAEPHLSLAVISNEGRTSRLEAASLPPWPIAIDRIVANELADAEQLAALRPSALDTLGMSWEQPSKAAHEKARSVFADRLSVYGDELREWLEQYVIAAQERAETFEIALELSNGSHGGHAEAVHVVLELPSGMEILDELTTVAMPPERPEYRPPQRTSMLASVGTFPAIHMPQALDLMSSVPRIPLELRSRWDRSADGRILETTLGEVHSSRSVALGDPLLMRAAGPGEHVLRWTAYSKSARQPAKGEITLIVPVSPERPPFGRLRGITSYPDIALVDDDGAAVHAVRTSDPPSHPEACLSPEGSATQDSLTSRLQERRAHLIWRELGLDPDDDGPRDVR